MLSLNKVLLVGNLTKDPELRYTPSGVPVATLRLAINTFFKDKSGEKRSDTCYINVVTWNKQAELCSQYLSKGRRIFIEGKLQSRSWERDNGERRSIIEVRADRIQFMGSPSGARQSAAPGIGMDSPDMGHPQSEQFDDFVGSMDIEAGEPTSDVDLPF